MTASSEWMLIGGTDHVGAPISIHIKGSTICCNSPDHASPGSRVEWLRGRAIVPAPIDIHVHGGAGVAVLVEGNREDDLQAATTRLERLARALAGMGTGAFVASVIATSLIHLKPIMLASAAMPSSQPGIADLLGVHLEGPYLSPYAAGAHPRRHLRTPLEYSLDCLIDDCAGVLPTMITVAPELPGSLNLIEQAVDLGILCAVGHTNATTEEVLDAISAGATIGTHFGNAMGTIHQRRPGAIGTLLGRRCTLELIANPTMLHPEVWRLATNAVGSERIILISDGMPSMDPESSLPATSRTYTFGGTAVRNEGNGSVVRCRDSRIWGNAMPLTYLIEAYHKEVGGTIGDRVKVSNGNAAKLLGRTEYSEMHNGNPATLQVLTATGKVAMTLVNGAIP